MINKLKSLGFYEITIITQPGPHEDPDTVSTVTSPSTMDIFPLIRAGKVQCSAFASESAYTLIMCLFEYLVLNQSC